MTMSISRLATILLAISGLLGACQPNEAWNGSLDDFLHSQPKRFSNILDNAETYRVQIIYTQIDRDADNQPSFRSYSYRLNPDEYFYPASTVKLPTSLVALEKVNGLNIAGLSRDTTMLTDVATDMQTPVVTDPSAANGLPSIGHYIRKVLLVSDNDAYNRLYEFIGQQQLNESLREKGLQNTRIFHRLEIARNAEENRITNPVAFVSNDSVIYEQAAQVSEIQYEGTDPILLGRAEMVDGRRLSRAKDFSANNAFSLQDQHDVMQALMFPSSVTEERRFKLTDDDYQFVYENMSAYPGESGIEEYSDPAQYPDGYVKFFMYGGSAPSIPDHIRIFSKPGDAYGFLTDSAYIVDFENGVEFILAATIYTNANETFNDDNYEYDETALPFLRDLGMAIYELELLRDREFAPDLNRFR